MFSYFIYTKTKKGLEWRAEDSFLAGAKLPVFSVADGVTLPRYGDTRSPTPARQAANIFCAATVGYVERHPEIALIDEVYNYAKNEIDKHYEKFAVANDDCRGVTGALAIVGKDTIRGSRFLDSGLALFREGREIFKTPEFWNWKEKMDPKPYPYITLNDGMKPYVQTYDVPYVQGDFLVLYTDGFEDQFSLAEFISIFTTKNLDEMKKKLTAVDVSLCKKNEEKWGHERTMAVVQL